jgi:hypothetical protein
VNSFRHAGSSGTRRSLRGSRRGHGYTFHTQISSDAIIVAFHKIDQLDHLAGKELLTSSGQSRMNLVSFFSTHE